MLKHYSHNAEWSITDFYLISDGIYMKHQKGWHTCDRCGVEIKVKPISEFEFMNYVKNTSDFSNGMN